jgi:GH15 family glucan-1,4-alpha-glucosidase
MPLIEDYALIGDCETAGLVGRDGSIDWLCFPRFDSPACFAALLGTADHGRWLLAPASPVTGVRRWYRGDTAVLETEFTTAEGVVSLIDFMPVRSGLPEVVRMVIGRRGRVPMRMDLAIRFDYGSVVPWVRRTPGGMTAVAGPDGLLLRAPVPVRGEDSGRPVRSSPHRRHRSRNVSPASATGIIGTAGCAMRRSLSSR